MGLSTVNSPSRFLEDIPQYLTTGTGVRWGRESQLPSHDYSWGSTSTDTPAPTGTIFLPELSSGDRVRHAQFGEGLVMSCQPIADDNEVVVAFRGVGIKKLLLSFARLEKME
jgi:DNA helicase-2/ATP-dependent DNA helicase PcrA